MRSAAARILHVARDRHDVAVLVQGEARRDQGAAAPLGLHDDDAAAQAGENAIAAREVPGPRRRPRRQLARDAALLRDLLPQAPVLPRVRHIATGADDGKGLAAGGQGTLVGRRIDATGDAAADYGMLQSELAAHGLPVAERPRVLVLNKIDLLEGRAVDAARAGLPQGEIVVPVSGLTRVGLAALVRHLAGTLAASPPAPPAIPQVSPPSPEP